MRAVPRAGQGHYGGQGSGLGTRAPVREEVGEAAPVGGRQSEGGGMPVGGRVGQQPRRVPFIVIPLRQERKKRPNKGWV